MKNDGHYFCRAGGNRPDGLNEPVTDILTGNTFADLEIRDSDGHLLLKVSAPEAGWTHESLNLVQPQEVQEGNDAFDAYLNGIWIGSTEV
ncbi:hypothetical protein OSX70_003846 [Escherichia coli]|nr:hypothetical protein [Escherichia coli]